VQLSDRVAKALASEPTVLAPPRQTARPLASWAVAAAASIAAVGVVGWTAYSLTQTPGTAIAKAREASSVTAAQVRPQALPQDYVLVHQEYSPATAIQGVRPYLRAVSAPANEPRP
jgi:sigma-E factor negative regulatory protein RseA